MIQAKSKNEIQEKSSGTNLTVRLILPTIFVLAITLTFVSIFGLRLSEGLYNHQTLETLKNNLQLTQKALNEGWEHTQGAAIRTEELLQKYTGQVLAGRLDFIGFHEKSGVAIVDSYTGKEIQTYPSTGIYINPNDIKKIIKHTNVGYMVTDLNKGGFAMSSYFAPLHLHLISFNKISFEQTSVRENQQILLISVFSVTAILLISMMLIVVHISITKPLRSMKKSMDNMIKKDSYESSLNNDAGSKDVQELSKRFNTLISHIDARDKQIHKHADELEDLVEERTNELQKAQQQLVLGERLAAIGEFASSVAHELRNPLSSIKMGVEKISEIKTIEGNNRRRLTLIRKEVDRLSEMLKGILAFAAPNPTDMIKINLTKFIDDLSPLLGDLAEEAKMVLKLNDVPEKLTVKADSDKLKQTFINIVKNACEAAPKESEIKVSFKDNGENIEIIVINNGEPIPKEVEGRLFEPFFTTKSSGTGLGLPTTKRLMNEMGGDILIKNAPNKTIKTTLILAKG